jgi:hypothetical protein
MTAADDRAPAGTCDADPYCMHVPCFQVQLEASRPRKAHRQSNACAYHVADIIQSLGAWAGQRALADGQLTILAIGSAADGRRPDGPGGPGDPADPGVPDRFDLHGFAFAAIPLTAYRLDPDTTAGSNPAEPES